MRIAVIGASGFVGRAVMEALCSRGHDVTAVVAPRIVASTYEPELYEPTVATLSRCLEGVDGVVNCAGVPDASSQDAARLFGANAVVPALVARALHRRLDVVRFVHVSSAVVQGRRSELDDSQEVDAFSVYAQSKAEGESLVRQELPLGSVIFRPPSVHSPDRRVTRGIAKIASSPVRSVAGPGPRPSPQALIANVGDAIAFLITCAETPPSVVIHPWEGVTTTRLMQALGGRRPHSIPGPIARGITTVLGTAGRWLPGVAPTARRVEMMWFGQGQQESWLTIAGWAPPVGPEGWDSLREALARVPQGSIGQNHPSALVATTIPMTLRHFYGELVGMLRREGYDVTLVSSSGHHLDAAVAETGARSHVIEMSRHLTPARDLRSWLSWILLIRSNRPAIVVAGTPKCALLAMTAAAVWRVPRRVYLCGGLRLEGSTGLLRYVLVWMERLTMTAATEVMVNSSTLKAEVLTNRLVSLAKLRQTQPGSTHGVNSCHFVPRDPDPAVQRDCGITEGIPVLGFVGRLTHDKGIDTLLEAASSLLRTGIRFHLLVVGPQDEPDSQMYVESLLSSGVSLAMVGPVEDVRPYYALLSMLVLPSLREGFPNVVLEAAAMEVPTITTTATGCRDSVLDQVTGVLVPPADGPALAVAIREAIENPEVTQAMGVSARNWVSCEFDPERVVGGWFHNPLASRPPTPRAPLSR